MSYYNTCGAHLDPCEVCDCKQNAAPVLEHKDGGEQIDKPVSDAIVSQEAANLQAFEKEFYSTVCKTDEPCKAMIEAVLHCKVKFGQVYHFPVEVYAEAVKRLESMGGEIHLSAANYIKENFLGGVAV